MKRIGFIDGRRVAGWVFPATATPGNGQVMTVLDPSTPAAGNVRASWTSMTSTGNKTGAVQTCAAAVTLNISGDSMYAYGRRTYVAVSGDPTVQYVCGNVVYIADIGASAVVTHICGIDLGVNNGNPPTGKCTFIRAYSHGAAVQSFAWLPSSMGITYLFDFEQNVAPIGAETAGAAAITNWRPIAVLFGATPRYMIMGDIA